MTIENIDEQVVKRGALDYLYREGILSRSAYEQALAQSMPPRQWHRWLFRLLSGAGVALVLSGFIYFFAFNWAAIPDLVKLFSIEVLLAGCISGAVWRGLNSFTGQMALLAGFVLLGVFMAVFGQIYQTGADDWQLFFNWAALGGLWVLFARHSATWLVWALVANLAWALWWQQARTPDWSSSYYFYLVMGSFNGILLVLREVVVAHGHRWLSGSPSRLILLLAVLLSFMPALISIVTRDGHGPSSMWLTGAIAAMVYVSLGWVYRLRLPDMKSLTALILSVAIVVECMLVETIDDAGFDKATELLSISLVSVVWFSVVVVILRHLHRSLPDE